MKKIIITKKRLRSLELGLSLDDILYEKFRRLNEDFSRRIAKERNCLRKIVRVIQGDRNLMVTRVVPTTDGLFVEVAP